MTLELATLTMPIAYFGLMNQILSNVLAFWYSSLIKVEYCRVMPVRVATVRECVVSSKVTDETSARIIF